MSSYYTGINNQLKFTLLTPGNKYYITKGSFLKIGIPIDFEIYDALIASSTCLKVVGFSDEVSCTLSLYTGLPSSKARHTLTITNGFASKDFEGGSVSFNISQIRNPRTS
jgi:hypothetical protein